MKDFREGGVAPQVVTATITTPAVDATSADTLDATLGVHAMLRTALAGANNDLDFIARQPGVSGAATFQTNMTGANNDLVFTAALAGEAGNDLRVRMINPGPSNALSVQVNGREIEVLLGTNASGVITSTAAQVTAALAANATANALVTAANAGGNDGTGVVTELDAAALSGGAAGTAITVTFTVAGNSTPLSVAVTGDAINILVGTTSGGAASSTAAQVKAAIEASAAASKLVIVNLQAGNDGTGVVAAAGSAPLVAPTGTTPTLDVTLQTDHGDGTWRTVKAFAQATTVSAQRDTFSPIGDRIRWNCVVGGTTPAIAFSISNVQIDTL